MTKESLFVGLMSGTSIDSIDAALVKFSNDKLELVSHFERPISAELKTQILELCQSGNHEIDKMGALDRQLGIEFSTACQQLLAQANCSPEHIAAIGSHGQTIRHRPDSDSNHAFTLQIGDPNTIAHLTGITTVSDFRRRDVAAGGQGAPLAPGFHAAAFSSTHTARAIVNIGGMANISYIPLIGDVIGFDTGPGNVLMDTWIFRNKGASYDRDGDWAASGTTVDSLINELLLHPYFSQPAPKSTGREAFNLEWLLNHLQQCSHNHNPADIQATLLELTARTISADIDKLCQGEPIEVYVCGGGAYNQQLMTRLAELLPQHTLASTKALGIAPEWVEAVAFAWLAKQTIERKPGNLPAVTGASKSLTLGGIYFS